jgi:N-acyl-D-amino-acid deacylase
MLDLLLKNATILDGTGSEPYAGHLGIRRDTLVGPWRIDPPQARRVLDVAGKILAPGFIDVHSHADLIHPLQPAQRRDLVMGRLAQGITSEIIGNCGLGACPNLGPASQILPRLNAWMTPRGSVWNWNSVATYLAVLEEAALTCNVGLLLPHGPLRVSAMGLGSGEPDACQLSLMKSWLEESLDAGVFGLSTGLIYPPGMFSSTDELKALAQIVGRRRRIYTSHVRGSSETLLESVEELLDIGRDGNVAVHHSHNEALGRDHWWKIERVLEREERAKREGIAISFDMFPYSAAATMMSAIYPPWSLEGGVEKLLERLGDAAIRKRIEEDIESLIPRWPPWEKGAWPHNLVRAAGWENIHIGSCTQPENKGFEFCSLRELGEKTGKSPFEAISDLMIADGGMISQIIFQVSGSDEKESNLERLLAHPLGIVATDANDFGRGRPHPAAYGAFPRILSRFVRERAVCSLPEAVRKMTSRPAELFGIDRRGVLREGYFADLVVLDYDRLADQSTYRDPRQMALGIEKVFVNGQLVLDDSRWVTENAGRLLRPR